MSQEAVESLMYDFSYNLFLANTSLGSIENSEDRQNVVKWIRFLKNKVKSIKEMKIRNDFMYYLVTNVQEGKLKSPFDQSPPKKSLISIASLLPMDHEENDVDDQSQANPTPTFGTGKKSEIFRRSPDGGEFLISQPIPDIGAFCYLAVVTKKKK